MNPITKWWNRLRRTDELASALTRIEALSDQLRSMAADNAAIIQRLSSEKDRYGGELTRVSVALEKTHRILEETKDTKSDVQDIATQLRTYQARISELARSFDAAKAENADLVRRLESARAESQKTGKQAQFLMRFITARHKPDQAPELLPSKVKVATLTLLMMASTLFGQPFYRNFFDTNQNPIVDVLSGGPNVTVTPSTTGTDQRHFTVAVTGGMATNMPILVAGTNIVIDVNGYTNTISVDMGALSGQFASSNALWVASNSLALYGIGVSNNVYAVTLYATGISNNVVAAVTYATGISNNTYAVELYATGISNNVVSAVTYATGISNAMMTASNALWTYTTGVSNNVVGAIAYTLGVSNLLGNYLPLAGGTETGPVLSTSPTTNGPAMNEFPVAGWVRGLFNNGIIDYSTTNTDLTATNPGSGQVMYTFSTTIPTVNSRTYTAPNASDYIGSVMTTNTFTFLQGPISVNAYLAAIGGSGNPSVSVHPEIYYSYDKTNWYGDWEAQNQTLTIGATNLYQWVVSFPAITSTNSAGFYLERRYKVGSAAGATHPNVVFLIGTNSASGTNDASHIAFSGPSSAYGNAFLSANQTFTGNNTFSQTINGSITGSAATATTTTNEVFLTNAVANLNLITLSTTSAGNYAAYSTNDNIVITGLNNVGASISPVQWAVRFYTNVSGATKTMTFPASFIGVNTTEYLTNQGVLSLVLYPGFGTNAVWRCLK